MQVKLLRFLNDGSYQPVGARAPREADVRIVAATHHDLAAAVTEGSFREDLFYRLKGVVLRTPTPPLAERAADVPLLASLFLRRTSQGRTSFSPDALNWLTGRSWPGNVRELRAAVECAAVRAVPGAAGTVVTAANLSFAVGDGPFPVESVAAPAPLKASKRKSPHWNAAASSRRSNAPGAGS
jgi:two-component system NtrC family response regulator